MQSTKLSVSIVGAAAAVGTLIFTIIISQGTTQKSVESLQEDVAALQDIVQNSLTSASTVRREDPPSTVQQSHAPSALEIKFQGKVIGAIEGLRLQSAKDDSSTLLVQLTATFPGFTATLDRILRKQGNFNSCSQRIYWAGGSSIRRYGASLALSSRVRYEQWICGFLGNHRIFRDTKTVHWSISVKPAPLDKLLIVAEVNNIKSLGDDLERLFGLRIQEQIKIPLPAYCGSCECAEIVKLLSAEAKDTRFSTTGNGDVRMDVNFSVASDLTGALGCLQ